jgi:DNA repair photolyase
MYEFITHTWNPILGKCPHDCKYCYVIYKYGEMRNETLRFDRDSLRDDFGAGKFIFVGSGVDLFADDIPEEWITRTLDKCYQDNNDLFGVRNRYLFQSKNPSRMLQFINNPIFQCSVVCTTIESNRYYRSIMNHAPHIVERAKAMNEIASRGIETYLTIEPIMSFDKEELIRLIRMCRPTQVNIGANTNNNIRIPEPTKQDIFNLVNEIKNECKVELKSNLQRLLA